MPASLSTSSIGLATSAPKPPGAVWFEETGLPVGTEWTVIVGRLWVGPPYPSYTGHGGAFNISLPSGEYQFWALNVSAGATLYLPSPQSGWFSNTGTSAMVVLNYSQVELGTLTLNQTGLPADLGWTASVDDRATGQVSTEASSGAPLVFELMPGSWYTVTVPGVAGTTTLWVPSPSVVNMTIGTSPVSLDVLFAEAPTYVLTFLESGLPAGTEWTIGVINPGGVAGWSFQSSTSSSINYSVSSAHFYYWLYWSENTSIPGLYAPSSETGGVTVHGAATTVNVTFRVVASNELTFDEHGLPPGTVWSAVMEGHSTGFDVRWTTNDTSEQVLVLSDTYYVDIWANSDNASIAYFAQPSSGNVTATSPSSTVNVTFVPAYAVTLTEAGLPGNDVWYVNASGLRPRADYGWQNSVTFFLPNGSYTLNVSTNDRQYSPSYRTLALSVNGASPSVPAVSFNLQTHPVTFVESGLPPNVLAKSGWIVALGGTTQHSVLGSITFGAVPNTTLATLITGPPGYRPTPIGSVNVTGPTSVAVAFTKGRTTNLRFTEEGLPPGGAWCADVEVASVCGQTPTLSGLNLPPGGYALSGVNASGWSGPIWVRVGGNLPVPFSPGISITVPKVGRLTLIFGTESVVTFAEVGLPSWVLSWSLKVDGTTWSIPVGDVLRVGLINGSYRFTAGRTGGYHAPGGDLLVSGAPVQWTVRFH